MAIMKRSAYLTIDDQVEFYKGAKHSDDLQNTLDNMKSWDAAKLARAVPAWAKPHFLPKTFKPNFEQRFPAWTYASTECKDTRDKSDFDGLWSNLTAEEYIAKWNKRHHYGKATIHEAVKPIRRKPQPFAINFAQAA